jgi:phage terminase large subunit-like protein
VRSKYPRNKAARDAIRFIENLTLVGDDSGKPVKLLPYQKEIVATIFGTLDRAGRRKIKKCFIFLPRKSAKTFIAACIVLYWLLGRGLLGQHCLSIANDKGQAALLFDMCKQIVEADPELDAEQGGMCEIVASTKRIAVAMFNSFYAALSTESSTKTGFNPSLVIVDEGQDIIDAEMVRNLTSGRTARDDYLTIYIGMAGTRKDTMFYEEYEYAKQWLAGIIKNDTYAAWIYESPEEDDWRLENTWKYHPAWGKFCKPQNVRDEYATAKDNAPLGQVRLNRIVQPQVELVAMVQE